MDSLDFLMDQVISLQMHKFEMHHRTSVLLRAVCRIRFINGKIRKRKKIGRSGNTNKLFFSTIKKNGGFTFLWKSELESELLSMARSGSTFSKCGTAGNKNRI